MMRAWFTGGLLDGSEYDLDTYVENAPGRLSLVLRQFTNQEQVPIRDHKEIAVYIHVGEGHYEVAE